MDLRELALQIQHACALLRGRPWGLFLLGYMGGSWHFELGGTVPLAMPLALQVGIGKFELPLRHVPALVQSFPGGVGFQAAHRHLGFFEHAGQKQGRALAHVQLHTTTCFAQVQLDLCAAQTGPGWQWCRGCGGAGRCG